MEEKTFYVKASVASAVGTGITLSDINQWLELIGGVGTLLVVGITLFKFVREEIGRRKAD